MITDRAEGLMRLSRLTKYALTTGTALATAALSPSAESMTSALSSMALPATILFLSLAAWGPSWHVWGRTYFHQPVQTTLRTTLADGIIVALSLLVVRLWPAVAVGIPLGLCLLTSATMLLLLNRFLPAVMARLLYGGRQRTRVLVLGPPHALELIHRQVAVGEAIGLEFINGTAEPNRVTGLRLFDPDSQEPETSPAVAPILSRIQQPDSPHAVDRVVFVRQDTSSRTLNQEQEIRQRCASAGLPLTIYVEHQSESTGTMVSQTAPAADPFPASQEPLQNPVNLAVKRCADILVSVPFVVFVLPPLCAIVWLIHRSQSSGPLFYRQKRCGLNGSTFHILKFRTMHVPRPGATDLEDNPAPRIFELGAVLRDSRLDEIPQFLNVLMGTMSVVGPRAHHGQDRDRFTLLVPSYPMRMQVKPGITGPAQYREYSGAFARNDVASRVGCDLKYIRRWSLESDVLLMLKTGRIIGESLSRNMSAKIRRRTAIETPAISTISLDQPVLAPFGTRKAADHPRDHRAA